MSRATAMAAGLGATALAGVGIVPWLLPRPVAEVWFELRWPRAVDVAAVEALLRQISAATRPTTLVLELRAAHGTVVHRVGVPHRDARLLPQIVRGWLPDLLLEPITTAMEPGQVKHAVELRLANRQRPLRADDPAAVARSILTAATAVGTGTTVVQWIVGPRLTPQFVTPGAVVVPAGWRQLTTAVGLGHQPMDGASRTALRAKVSDFGFRACLRIGTSIANRRVAYGVLRRVASSFRVAEGPGAHFALRPAAARNFAAPRWPWRWPVTVNVGELVGLVAWPVGEDAAPGVARVASRRLPVPAAVPTAGRVFGDGNHPSTGRPVGQHARDTLTHTLALGVTGVGKSTLLANFVTTEMVSGRSVVLLEPKDLVAEVLARVPAARIDDVVVLDATDDDAVVGINPLAGGPPELVTDHVMAVFRGLFGDAIGPRTADVLHAAVLTLARGHATLASLPWLLSDPAYRRQLTTGLSHDLQLGPFWAWFDALSDAHRNEVIAPALNKTRFLLRERVRRVVGQATPRFALSDAFTARKTVLVPLPKGILGAETAGLLGSMIVATLWRAAQARTAVPPERRHGVTIVIDEFPDFVHLPTDLGDVLAQARGLGVGLVLAHQHLGQLSTGMRTAVLANARTKICFRLSNDDAAIMARTTDGLEAIDFQRLGRYEAYAAVVAQGATQPYCSLSTRPLPPPVSDPTEVRRRSRQRYARSVQAIDAELRRVATGTAPSLGAIGTRRRPPR